jgi:hypothetical protein
MSNLQSERRPMARQESDREDLLAEARNLIERVSLRLAGQAGGKGDEIIAGFRRDGSLAIYFSPQQVYQFTSFGALRRAFVDDMLYKAQRGMLVAMRRDRTAEAVHLVSRPLTANEQRDFLTTMRQALDTLQQGLQSGAYHCLGKVPADADVSQRVLAWLDQFAANISIAQAPNSR